MTTGKLILRGWKGFDGALRLWPVTFLVGPNGSGKSSLLESLALLSHLARRGTLREDLRPWLRGWPDGIFSRTGGSVPAGEMTLKIEWGQSRYELVLRAGEHPEITTEELS